MVVTSWLFKLVTTTLLSYAVLLVTILLIADNENCPKFLIFSQHRIALAVISRIISFSWFLLMYVIFTAFSWFIHLFSSFLIDEFIDHSPVRDYTLLIILL